MEFAYWWLLSQVIKCTYNYLSSIPLWCVAMVTRTCCHLFQLYTHHPSFTLSDVYWHGGVYWSLIYDMYITGNFTITLPGLSKIFTMEIYMQVKAQAYKTHIYSLVVLLFQQIHVFLYPYSPRCFTCGESILKDMGEMTWGLFNIKLSSYQHRDTHVKDKRVFWLSYL